MKLVMYGTEICPDCVEAKEQLKKKTNIELDYRDITKTTGVLKEFLSYRDHESMFTRVIEGGRIGIPFFILEDGTKTFEIFDYLNLKRFDSERAVNSCSIDGQGHC